MVYMLEHEIGLLNHLDDDPWFVLACFVFIHCVQTMQDIFGSRFARNHGLRQPGVCITGLQGALLGFPDRRGCPGGYLLCNGFHRCKGMLDQWLRDDGDRATTR